MDCNIEKLQLKVEREAISIEKKRLEIKRQEIEKQLMEEEPEDIDYSARRSSRLKTQKRKSYSETYDDSCLQIIIFIMSLEPDDYKSKHMKQDVPKSTFLQDMNVDSDDEPSFEKAPPRKREMKEHEKMHGMQPGVRKDRPFNAQPQEEEKKHR